MFINVYVNLLHIIYCVCVCVQAWFAWVRACMRAAYMHVFINVDFNVCAHACVHVHIHEKSQYSKYKVYNSNCFTSYQNFGKCKYILVTKKNNFLKQLDRRITVGFPYAVWYLVMLWLQVFNTNVGRHLQAPAACVCGSEFPQAVRTTQLVVNRQSPDYSCYQQHYTLGVLSNHQSLSKQPHCSFSTHRKQWVGKFQLAINIMFFLIEGYWHWGDLDLWICILKPNLDILSLMLIATCTATNQLKCCPLITDPRHYIKLAISILKNTYLGMTPKHFCCINSYLIWPLWHKHLKSIPSSH